jgi:catechol 2,3-dioxygenase-like lactoylglutathione lyase family enzyme
MTQSSTNPLIQGLGFHHISISTLDMEKSLEFYCSVLGMQVFKETIIGERRLVQLDIGDGMLVEVSDASPEVNAANPAPIPLNHIGFVTTDLTGAVERVRAAGYPITVEPRRISAGPIQASLAFVKGPNGESIEFMQFDE